MLTVLDAISAAGRRTGQNDDCVGWTPTSAWVLDGATDIHGDDPLIPGAASDAAWFSQSLNRALYAHAPNATDPTAWFIAAAKDASDAFKATLRRPLKARWEWPVCAGFGVFEAGEDLILVDVGDCAAFARNAVGETVDYSARETGKDDEHAEAAKVALPADGEDRYKNPDARHWLKKDRSDHNTADGYVAFGLDADWLAQARVQRIAKAGVSHLLLMSDGFSVIQQVFGVYSPGETIEACLQKGCGAVLQEIRAIEEAGGAGLDRWKKSDDASALLIRVD